MKVRKPHPRSSHATLGHAMSPGNAILRSTGCVASVVASVACTLLYQPAEQCEEDSDCIRLALTVPTLRGSLCQEHTCALPAAPRHDCETNTDCIDTFKGDAAVCRDFQCIKLGGGACSVVLNEEILPSSNDVVVLGAFERLLQFNTTTVRGGLESYTLAKNEMQERVHGAIGVEYAAVRRPFVIVVCDNTPGPNLDAAFDHLTKDLKVPVVVTTVQPPDLLAQWLRLSSDPTFNTMFINAFASDSSLEEQNTGGRIWSLLGSPKYDLAPAFAQLVDLQLGKVTTNPARVLTITNGLVAMEDIASEIERRISWSTGSLGAAINAGIYRKVRVAAAECDGVTAPSAVRSAIDELRPDVIIVLAGEEHIPSIAYAEQVTPSPPKYYVLSQHLANSPSLLWTVSNAGLSTDLYQRMLGVNYAGAEDRTLYDAYFSNLKALNKDAPEGYENFYDAAHFAMLSVVGVAAQRPTSGLKGVHASEGFRRLIDLAPGVEQVGLRADNLANIATTLERSDFSTIALTGTLGSPDFSTQTGTRHTDAAVWCYRQKGSQLQWTQDVVRFNRETGFSQDPDFCHRSVE